MVTVNKEVDTHYVNQYESFGNPNWLEKFKDGDIVIMDMGNGVKEHYIVQTFKQLRRL